MQFLQSTPEDLSFIFHLYDAAIEHQKAVSNQHWLPFDQALVEREIAEGRQWKIVIDGQIACVFMVAYNDAAIWGAADEEPSVYLHRIVTNPDFRGQNFVQHIVNWAQAHGSLLGKRYLRLDTWADNPRLHALYIRCGFTYLGARAPHDTSALPMHYSAIVLGYFEMPIIV
jgi:ribosomal protein S18 acetylase RimI-like enzyme